MVRRFVILSLVFISSLYGFSQELILSEIVASNAESYVNTDGKSYDWIELRNTSSLSVDLSEYSLTSKSSEGIIWQLPSKTLLTGAYALFEAHFSSSSVAQWESIIDYGDTCLYFVPNSSMPTLWTALDFDDSQWAVGCSPFGYGETKISTNVGTCSSVFLRKKFIVSNLKDLRQLILNMDCDDGFIAYINGVECARFNMSGSNYDDYATEYSEGVIKDGGTPAKYIITNPQSVLKQGENVLSIQVHNCSATSSDLIATPILSLGYASKAENRKDVSSYVSLSSNIAPFSVSASSDVVFLLKQSKIIDSVVIEDLPVDVSIGRIPDDSQFYYFQETTPGKANSINVYSAKTLSAPKLTIEGGVFKTARFYVSAYSTDKQVTLRYTTNGSIPTETSKIFPDSMYILSTTNLRVRAFRLGYLPSETKTESYFVIQRTQQLPIASITVNHDDFFSEETGIYMEGPNAETEEPHFGANYWQDWEREVHFEYFLPAGNRVVSQDVGAKIGGNWSRARPQKSLKLYARDKYGKDKIKYQFFNDKPISEFHSIILRNSGNDCMNTHMRDGVISILAKQMNMDRQAYQPSVVYINGAYYGIQNVREKINASYIEENYGCNKDSIDIITNYGELSEGNTTDFWKMRNFITNTDFSVADNYKELSNYLDINNFIDYNILEMYVVNEDWPGNNIKYWHSRSGNTPWRYILFDADFGLGIWDADKVNHDMLTYCTAENSSDYSNAPWSTEILRKLLKNQDFVRDFMNYTADRLNTTLSSDSVIYVIDSIETLINTERSYHAKRWYGDSNTYKSNTETMRAFARSRENVMRSQTEDFFATTGSYELTLNISAQDAGIIHLNSIDVTHFPWSGQYFKNNEIFLTAIPRIGYKFVRWEGSVNSTDISISVDTSKAINLTAIFDYVGNEPQISITEVYYNSKGQEPEWIEIHNEGENMVNLSGYKVEIDMFNQEYLILNETMLMPDDYLILTKDTAVFKNQHPDIDAVGNLSFSFSKTKANIKLRDTCGNIVASLVYSDRYPYPEKSDGYGYSFELMGDDANSPLSWRGATLNGSPGIANNKIQLEEGRENIVINEINNSSLGIYDSGDWFELYNNNDFPVNIAGWLIKDKNDNISLLSDEDYPDGLFIPAKGYIVFAKNPGKFHFIYPDVSCVYLDFSLNAFLDGIRLYDKYEFLVDSVHYSLFESTWSHILTGCGFSLQSPELDNSYGKNWAASLNSGTPMSKNTFYTAIEDVDIVEMEIYPNPCTDYIKIESRGQFSYRIIAETGNTLIEGTALNYADVSLRNIPDGIYMVIIVNNNIPTSKIILKGNSR